jgi:hypothetical protein
MARGNPRRRNLLIDIPNPTGGNGDNRALNQIHLFSVTSVFLAACSSAAAFSARWPCPNQNTKSKVTKHNSMNLNRNKTSRDTSRGSGQSWLHSPSPKMAEAFFSAAEVGTPVEIKSGGALVSGPEEPRMPQEADRSDERMGKVPGERTSPRISSGDLPRGGG